MRPTPRTRAALLTALALVAVAGCQNTAGRPESKASTVTPTEAHAHLKDELFAVAKAAIPAGQPVITQDVKDAPCGGSQGTEHSRVKSSIYVSNGDPKLSHSADEVIQAAAEHLRAQGWQVQPIERNNDGSVIAYAGKGGFSVRVTAVMGTKKVELGGDTPCVDNPDR
jgi:hypothetical protein